MPARPGTSWRPAVRTRLERGTAVPVSRRPSSKAYQACVQGRRAPERHPHLWPTGKSQMERVPFASDSQDCGVSPHALPPRSSDPRRHLLTIGLEDYFQVGAFNRLIQRGQWYRFESRLQVNTRRTLDLLRRFDVKATFFVLGWVADRFPEIVREVAAEGHDIASKG